MTPPLAALLLSSYNFQHIAQFPPPNYIGAQGGGMKQKNTCDVDDDCLQDLILGVAIVIVTMGVGAFIIGLIAKLVLP